MRDELAAPKVVDRSTFHAELDALRVREKAHMREGDAIAAARRRLPMLGVDPSITLIGPQGPVTLLEVFEGRRMLIAYYFMWHTGHPAPEQREGSTWVTSQVDTDLLPIRAAVENPPTVCEAAPTACAVVICFASFIGSSRVLELSTNGKSAPFPAR
jgi:predicted dithiol-disulfide oxidoreductase (DUF899 family)